MQRDVHGLHAKITPFYIRIPEQVLVSVGLLGWPYICKHLCIHVHPCMPAHLCICVHTCIYLCIPMHIRACLHTCVYSFGRISQLGSPNKDSPPDSENASVSHLVTSDCVTPSTVAHKAPLPMGFSRRNRAPTDQVSV